MPIRKSRRKSKSRSKSRSKSKSKRKSKRKSKSRSKSRSKRKSKTKYTFRMDDSKNQKEIRVKYTEVYREILNNWIGNLIEGFITEENLYPKNSSMQKADKIFAVSSFKEEIYECYKNLMNLYMKKHNNMVFRTKLQTLGLTALIISLKTILQYDYYNDNKLEDFAKLCDGVCDTQDIKNYEIELLILSDWKPCNKSAAVKIL